MFQIFQRTITSGSFIISSVSHGAKPKPSNNLKRAANIFKLDELSSCPAYLSIRRIRPAFPIGAFYCLGHVKLPVCSICFLDAPQLSISRTIRIERRIRPRGLFGVLLHNFVEIYLQSLCRTESTLKLAQWQMASGIHRKNSKINTQQQRAISGRKQCAKFCF